MSKPTHDDADVMLRLVQIWPFEATNWIWSDDFEPDHEKFMAARTGRGASDEGLANVRAVLNWYETIGTLYKNGLINEDLLFDWLAIDAVWQRVKSHALAHREHNHHMYENFEAMASAQREWTAARDRAAA
jgi:hypothetical protein